MLLRVKKNTLIWLLGMYVTLALTLPYEWRIGILSYIFSASLASLIIIPIYFLCHVKSGLMKIYLLYNFVLLLSTYINGIPIKEQMTLSLMGVSLVGAFELINKFGSIKQYKIYTFYFSALVIINSLQTIYYGSSRNESGYLCIFGNKNWYLYRILPAIFLILLYLAKQKKNIFSLYLAVVWSMAMISVMIAGSGAGTLVLLLWGIYIVLIPFVKKIKQNEKFDNYIVYMLIILFVFLVIVVWNAAEIFAPIIVGLLGKDLTFTTRTRIWTRAIELISKKPFIGYGVMESNDVVSLFYGIPDFTTTHNQYLGELFRGGIPLLAIFICLIITSFRGLQRSNNIDIKKTMSYGIFCLLLWWMMESITSMYLVLVLFICYHLPENSKDESKVIQNG